MEAILALQAQLKQLQSAQPNQAHKLNERNVVDIVRKILA